MKALYRTISTLALVCATLVMAASASAADLAGVRLAETERVANQNLVLNGAGVRTRVIFKVYAIALYLGERTTSATGVLGSEAPKRVSIVLLRDVGNEAFAKAFREGIEKNSDKAERARIAAQLTKFNELFAAIPEVKKGDVLTLDWIPGSGTLVQLNGKKMTELIPDPLFYSVFLRIWLGEKPAEATLKRRLLGQQEAAAE
ncbi:chalcone isomerase family protein [soil metagenome]